MRTRLPWVWCTALCLVAMGAPACSSGGPAVTSPSGSTSSPPTTQLALPSRSAPDWPTYMGDAARTGIGPASPAASTPHRTWTATVDGDVYGQPLVAGSSVIAATEQNNVYSLDAATGAVRWRAHLGTPVPLSQLQCGNIDPNGITSTPVVDTATGTIYAVAMLATPVRHELFALRLADGSVVWHRPVDVAGADPGHHQQRGALNLAAGHVYFSYGGFEGDCDPYHGRVIAAPTDGTGPIETWQVPSEAEGAIWAPPGPVISSTGDVWVSTGNTANGPAGTADAGPYDGANSVMRLDAALSGATDQWAPKDWASLNRQDIDLGSMAPALLPGGLVFAAGKEGIGYLLRADHLGGIGGEVFSKTVCPGGGPQGGAFGGAAVAGTTLFVPCRDGVTAVRVDTSKASFSVAWQVAKQANTPLLAYGWVWTVVADTLGLHAAWSGSLVGLDPVTGAEKARVKLGGIPHFPSIGTAGGSLYVGGLGSVYALAAA
jgi:outer membrane protein assembly factor BamB